MYLTPPQAPSTPPRPGRTGAIVVMAIGTVLYVLSLLGWLPMLIMSPMLFDSESNAPVATVIILALLGWPVAIVACMVVGWWKRTIKVALIALAIPLVWILLMGGVAEAVNPDFLNIRDFLPQKVEVQENEATLAGLTLNKTTRADVQALLGTPEQTEPSDAETAKAWRWEYPGKGIQVQFSDDLVTGIATTTGFTGETARGLRIGDPWDRAFALYGETQPTGTSYDNGVETAHDYSYYGKWYDLHIRTDGQNQVKEIAVRVNP